MSPAADPRENTTSGSAVRHAVTGVLAAVLASFFARRGIPVDPAAVPGIASEVSGAVFSLGVAVSAGAASALGGLWRRFVVRR